MTTERLAADVGWEASGHLSEVALSAVADGEDALLDEGMRGHLDGCDACAERLGQVALRSADVAEAFGLVQARTESVAAHTESVAALASPARGVAAATVVRERRKVPWVAIAAAMAIALLGIAPSLLSAPDELAQTWSVVRKVAPSFVRLLPQAAARAWSGQRGAAVIVVWGLAAVLVATGFGIAKRASKRALVDGGRQ